MRTPTILVCTLLCAACGSTTSPTDGGSNDSAAQPDSAVSTPDASMEVGSLPDASSYPDASSVPDATAVSDASNPFADAGALGEPAWVPITVLTTGTCPTLTPCGGDVLGTWDVSGACIEVPIESALDACPGTMITGREGRARGRVTFTAMPNIARRVAQSEATVEAFVPQLCAMAVGGCAGLQSILQRGAPTATCAATESGCNCTATAAYTIDDGDGYTIQGNEIVSSTLMKRWEYCIADTGLRYRDSSPSGPREPGTITLRRR
jgi:hypothetical protein